MSESRFELPGKIDQYLAVLHRYYKKNGKQLLARILSESRLSIEEETHSDNWNGGQYYHTINLHIPADLYTEILDRRPEISKLIDEDLSRMSTIPDEHIHSVIIDIDENTVDQNWKNESQVGRGATDFGAPENSDGSDHLWRDGYLRLFISHKSSVKENCRGLAEALEKYGISGFVAHDVIEPTREWQKEIESALSTMHAAVAILTSDYHASDWTDQEIGVAIGRGIPILSVRFGLDPYGFIGKYQGLPGKGKSFPQLAKDIFEIFFKNPTLSDRIFNGLINRLMQANTYSEAKDIFQQIEKAQTAKPELIDLLESTPAQNDQVRDCFYVQERLSALISRLRGS